MITFSCIFKGFYRAECRAKMFGAMTGAHSYTLVGGGRSIAFSSGVGEHILSKVAPKSKAISAAVVS